MYENRKNINVLSYRIGFAIAYPAPAVHFVPFSSPLRRKFVSSLRDVRLPGRGQPPPGFVGPAALGGFFPSFFASGYARTAKPIGEKGMIKF